MTVAAYRGIVYKVRLQRNDLAINAQQVEYRCVTRYMYLVCHPFFYSDAQSPPMWECISNGMSLFSNKVVCSRTTFFNIYELLMEKLNHVEYAFSHLTLCGSVAPVAPPPPNMYPPQFQLIYCSCWHPKQYILLDRRGGCVKYWLETSAVTPSRSLSATSKSI
jgi:hypothetical protein